jgi:hypothetical protein
LEEVLQELEVRGKKLAFKRVYYVSQHILIASLPFYDKLGLFYRDGGREGKECVKESRRAMKACQVHLTSLTPHLYKGVSYMELGGNYGSEEEAEVSQVDLRGRLAGSDVQGLILRALEQFADGEDVSFDPQEPETA